MKLPQHDYEFGNGTDVFYTQIIKNISRPHDLLGDGVIQLKDYGFWET